MGGIAKDADLPRGLTGMSRVYRVESVKGRRAGDVDQV
jgi:hypothetical protein